MSESDDAVRAEDDGPDEGKEGGRRRPPLPLVLLVVGALGAGTLLGWSLRTPENAPVYLELSEQHESTGGELEQALVREADHEDTINGLQEELEQLEGPILKLDEREEGLDTREGELDDREEELTEFSEELDEREGDLDTREEEVTGLETEAEENSFPGTGTFLVGDEISPGTYRSEGTSSCYWARLSGTGGTLDSIIANNFGGGRQVVTISGSDVAFETSSCGGWTRI
ncbi:hypothetical protein [Nocardiopsis metallicus]|uniref:Uncharacterized protein n=1 Tax=Nocardiopsis metallicus TaxID=179819 RepID=A0A840W421_9ACTN|nr:hypothetical protein [Nocardiopsis metallicus]MBB5490812.1 hypothetical protein [Nocardiopsis metallicus]